MGILISKLPYLSFGVCIDGFSIRSRNFKRATLTDHKDKIIRIPYMSFYDFIRIYTYDDLLQYQYTLDIPIQFIETHPELKWDYAYLAKTLPLQYISEDSPLFNVFLCNMDDLSRNPSLTKELYMKYKRLPWYIHGIRLYCSSISLIDYLNDGPTREKWSNANILIKNNNLPLSIIIDRTGLLEVSKVHTDNDFWVYLSRRIDEKYLDLLYTKYKTNLNWQYISNLNPNISAEYIMSRPNYPWLYHKFANSTIDYYRRFNSSILLLSSSLRISLKDIINNPDIPFNLYGFIINPNFNCTELYEHRQLSVVKQIYSQLLDYNSINHIMDRETLNNRIIWRQKYEQVIMELKYQQFGDEVLLMNFNM